MKIIFLINLIISLSYQVCWGQKLSFQTGLSSDLYFASKSNNQYNKKPEVYSDLLGLNISYTFIIDSIKQNEINFFMDIYRFNFGTSVKSYPETENMDIKKMSTSGLLSPSFGLLYSFPIIQDQKFSTFLMLGSSVRFSIFSMSAKGTFHNVDDSGVEYVITNELNKIKTISFALNVAGQLRYKINKRTNLLVTPLTSFGTFNWYKQRYNYKVTKNNEIIENGTNTMNNNGSRLQLLIGMEFRL